MTDEIRWQLYDQSLAGERIYAFKELIAFTIPRRAIPDYVVCFRDIEEPWAQIASIFFKLNAQLALSTLNVRVVIEAVRLNTGEIWGYTFYTFVNDEEPIIDHIFAILFNTANASKRPDTSLWKMTLKEGLSKLMELLRVYRNDEYNPNTFNRISRNMESKENPVVATNFFRLGYAFKLRLHPDICEEQKIASVNSYITMSGDFEFTAPKDTYEFSREDILRGELLHWLLPEVQIREINAKSIFLDIALANEESETIHQEENGELLYNIDFQVNGNESNSADDYIGQRVIPTRLSFDEIGSIYTRIGHMANRKHAEILKIANDAASFKNPLLIARKLYLELQKEIVEQYRIYCSGCKNNLSRNGKILTKFIKSGGANKRHAPRPIDPSLSSFANWQVQTKLDIMRAFSATENATALIVDLRNYMYDAFILDVGKLHLNAILNSRRGGVSKSFSAQVAAKFFPKDVVRIVSYVTERAFFADDDKNRNQNQEILVFDDTNPKIFETGANNTASDAILKSILTTCMISAIRNVEDPLNQGKRKREEINTEFSHCFIFLANIEWLLSSCISQPMLTRLRVIPVNERTEALKEINLMQYHSLREADALHEVGITLQLTDELQAHSAIFFETCCLIACGALRKPTTFVVGVVLQYLDEWLKKRNYRTDGVRDTARIARLASIKCIQDAIYRLFFRQGAKYYDKRFETAQLLELDRMLVVNLEHTINSIGEQADLIINPYEYSILKALGTIWKNQRTSSFWCSAPGANENDATYMRFLVDNASNTQSTSPTRFSKLAHEVSRCIHTLGEKDEFAPSPDAVCYYLHGLCTQKQPCRAWKRSGRAQIGTTPSTMPYRANVVGADNVVQESVQREGEETRKVRPIALQISDLNTFSIGIQADIFLIGNRHQHLEVLKEAIKDLLSHAKQRGRRILFCHSRKNPSFYDILDIPESREDAPTLKIKETIINRTSFRSPARKVLIIDDDIDLMALRRRNNELFVNAQPISSLDIVDDTVLCFFGKELYSTGKVYSKEDVFNLLQEETDENGDIDFNRSDFDLDNGENHCDSIGSAAYKLLQPDSLVDNDFFVRRVKPQFYSYPKDLIETDHMEL